MPDEIVVDNDPQVVHLVSMDPVAQLFQLPLVGLCGTVIPIKEYDQTLPHCEECKTRNAHLETIIANMAEANQILQDIPDDDDYDDAAAERDALNREAEEEALGRPLFPNEY